MVYFKQCNIDDSRNPKNEISIKESPDEFEQIPDDHQISDHLLSKALFNLKTRKISIKSLVEVVHAENKRKYCKILGHIVHLFQYFLERSDKIKSKKI